jgi:hypothetical protein
VQVVTVPQFQQRAGPLRPGDAPRRFGGLGLGDEVLGHPRRRGVIPEEARGERAEHRRHVVRSAFAGLLEPLGRLGEQRDGLACLAAVGLGQPHAGGLGERQGPGGVHAPGGQGGFPALRQQR